MSVCLDENAALELLDGKLPSSSRARVERHLEECEACRELVAELAQISAPSEPEDRAPDTERIHFAENAKLHPGDHVGPYRIGEAIGEGGAGIVYRAVDTRTGQVIALKHLTDAALRSRFAREAEILARLDHPGIVRYVGHGETPGGMYLAMEWLDGEDLEKRFRRGPLEWGDARTLGVRLAAALGHAHAIGCVHRDLSPKNVFLPSGLVDRAKLLDFGLVRVPDPGLDRTASQAVLGTPFYMSPEQVRDPKSVDARADLFGLGVLLYEAVSGRRPFEGADLFTVWIRIVDQPTPDLRPIAPAVPEGLIRVIERLLAKDPSARPPSAADVAQMLEAVGTGPPIIVSTAPMKRPPELMRPRAVPDPPAGGPLPGASTAATAPAYPPLAPGSGRMVITPASSPGAMGVSTVETAPRGASRGRVLLASLGVGMLIAATLAVRGVYTDAAKKATDALDEVKGASTPAKAVATDADGPGTDEASDPNSEASQSPPNSDPPKAGESNGKPKTPAKAEDAEPNAGGDDAPTAPAAAAQAKDAGRPLPETLHCGDKEVSTRKGGHYIVNPNVGIGAAVTAGNECRLTLEDCIIDGPHSISILHHSSVTLRRCKVAGEVKLVGAPTLHLYDTTLPSAPTITGTGKVVRH